MRSFILFFLLLQPIFANEFFDLRDQGYVSSPRFHTGEHSWVFATINSLESNILIESSWPDESIVDLSERNIIKEKYLIGDYKMAAAYLSNFAGALSEENKTKFLPSSIEWLTYGSHQVNIERIQEAILVNGSVGSLAHRSNSYWEIDLNGDYIDFNFENKETNHFVNIIGWDNKRTIPPYLPGVWIIQDSDPRRGSSYYLTPYGNRSIAQDKNFGGVSFNQVRPIAFKNIYSHARNGAQYTFSATRVSNIYNLKDELPIKVGIYTVIPDDSAVVIVSDLSGNIICHSKNRALSNPGFYLLDLACGNKSKVEGEVRVEFITESGLYAHDGNKAFLKNSKPFIIKTNSSYKESYYLKNGKWIDFKSQYFKASNQHGVKVNYSGSGNFAINLYTH